MCLKPLNLNGDIFACGQCRECLIKRSKEWTIRLEAEAKHASSGAFITMTYNDENAIWSDCEESPDGMCTHLNKKDVQLFIKRVRKANAKKTGFYDKKIKYFAIGEYGPETYRAHYHALIFNLHNDIRKCLSKYWTTKEGNEKGWFHAGDVTPKSIRYVTDYMCLKTNKRYLIQKPMNPLISNGIGKSYLKDSLIYHKITGTGEAQLAGKVKRNLPKYLRDKVLTDEQIEKDKKRRIKQYEEFLMKKEDEAYKNDPLDPKGFMDDAAKVRAEQKIKRKTKFRKL